MNDFEKAMSVHQFDYMGYCGMKKRMVRWTLDCMNCVKKSAVNPDMNFTPMIDLERECFNKSDKVRERALEAMSEGERNKIFTVLLPGCSFQQQKMEGVEIDGKKTTRAIPDGSKTVPTELVKTMIFVGKKHVSLGKSYHCRKCGAELSPAIFKAKCQTVCHVCGAEVTKPRIRRNIIRRVLKFVGLKK